MRILMNRNYFFGIPNCSQQATTLIVLQAKQLYPKELKNARLIITDKPVEDVGVLTKRTI